LSRTYPLYRVAATAGIILFATAGVAQLAGAGSTPVAQAAVHLRPDGPARVIDPVIDLDAYKTQNGKLTLIRLREIRRQEWQARVRRTAIRKQEQEEAAQQAAQEAAAAARQVNTSVPAASAGSFEQCVEIRESGGDPTAYNPSTASGLFGIELPLWTDAAVPGLLAVTGPYPGGAYTAPPGVQIEAFNLIYADMGVSPWAPYDGC
jgi:hypothetical protein